MSSEYTDLLRDLESQRFSVMKQQKCGIISFVDSIKELDMIKRKETKLKKTILQSIHVGKGGKERKISYLKSKGLWYTKMPDGKKIYAKELEDIYVKLFTWYNIKIADYRFSSIFELAITEKLNTDNDSLNTITHYRYDYKRFISEELGERNIKEVTDVVLKTYAQSLVQRMKIKDKAFLKFKGILNLTFEYALNQGIICENPASKIDNARYLKSCERTTPIPEKKILSEEEIDAVKAEVRKRVTYTRYHGYFINGYAILFSIETGVRAAEIPALKWSDVTEDFIHIHAQQLNNVRKGGKEYYYAPWTKDEKGISCGGRKYPLTDTLKALLDELRALQGDLGIESDYIFCHEDGEWIKTDAYETCLRRLMRSAGMSVTNNHAFRMSLNSNVFIGRCNLPVTERARLLGHSVETNLKYYSFGSKDGLKDVKALLNKNSGREALPVTPQSPPNVVDFEKYMKKKTPENREFSRVSNK